MGAKVIEFMAALTLVIVPVKVIVALAVPSPALNDRPLAVASVSVDPKPEDLHHVFTTRNTKRDFTCHGPVTRPPEPRSVMLAGK